METNTFPASTQSADTSQDSGPKLLGRAAEQASVLAQRSLDAVRQSKEQLREKALRASDGTVAYIKDEPVKAMLIAAATGAALMALVGLLSRPYRRS